MEFGGEDLTVQRYTDSNFPVDIDDRKSISRFVFSLNKGAISWRSCKQDTTVDSTTEAKYIPASEAVKEAVWIHKFIQELEVVPSIESPITIYCDNNGVVANVVEPRAHQRTKHIARQYHLIRDIIRRGDVAITKMDSTNNVADPLTKALSRRCLRNIWKQWILNTCMIGFECKWVIVRIMCPQKQYYAIFLFDNKILFSHT